MEATRCRLERRRRGINIDKGKARAFILPHIRSVRFSLQKNERLTCAEGFFPCLLEGFVNDLPGKKRHRLCAFKKKEEERNPPNSVVADCIASQCSLDT